MDPLFLSRLQFAAAAMFHFLFVPLTLGLSILVAVMETQGNCIKFLYSEQV